MRANDDGTGPGLTTLSIVRQADCQSSCELGEERVLLNVETGIYYGLDAVGARIWELIDEPRAVEDVRDVLVKEFDVDAATCEADLLALLRDLAAAGLVQVESGAGG